MKRVFGSGRTSSAKSRSSGRVGKTKQTRSKQPEAKPKAENSQQRTDEEQWRLDMATLRQAAEEMVRRRAFARTTALQTTVDIFHRLAGSLDDASDENRGTTVRDLYNLDPERAASYLNIALHEGSPEERRQIAAALEASGLVEEAINNLTRDSHQHSYRAFSLLFLVAKAGAVQPLLRLIESHPSLELRLALIRLLASSGERDLVFQFQRLLSKDSLPAELNAAIREAVSQLGDSGLKATPSAA